MIHGLPLIPIILYVSPSEEMENVQQNEAFSVNEQPQTIEQPSETQNAQSVSEKGFEKLNKEESKYILSSNKFYTENENYTNEDIIEYYNELRDENKFYKLLKLAMRENYFKIFQDEALLNELRKYIRNGVS